MPGRPADTPFRPIIFGEVLFDCFDDGSEVLGGAPLNVAWHLRGLGLDPLLVTRVGDDEPGARVMRAMRDAGLDPAAVQSDPERPTGRVRVSVDDGQPDFAIDPDQAWDRIDAGSALEDCGGGGGGILYHGTLALRSPGSRAALEALRGNADRRIFLDVNLRDPWWSPETVAAAAGGATWVKLNDDELRRLEPDAADPAEAAARLAAESGIEGLIVTRGADGAFWADANGVRAAVGAAAPAEVVDTVGAGDAFAAVCIFGLLDRWPVRDMLERAAAVAAAVCARRGAVPAERDFHARFLAGWR